MPKCQNCGSHVSADFVRVSFPDDVTDPPGCPECPDLTKKAGKPGYRKIRYKQ